MNYDYLEHHGILGQKWGVRRYQNPDGSYTSKGKKRHASETSSKSTGSKIKQHMKKVANKKISELKEKQRKEIEEMLLDILNPMRNKRQPWDEKPHPEDRPWTEKPSKDKRGNI